MIQTHDISSVNHSVRSGLYLINSLKTGIYLDYTKTSSSYLTVNTVCFHYKTDIWKPFSIQSILVQQSYSVLRYSLSKNAEFWLLNLLVHVITNFLQKVNIFSTNCVIKNQIVT